ncbi:hypothetical protein NGDEOPKE_00036 [Enterococcus phage vB_OCPT_Carl]|uniref:Uncharacterized protein n=1 Tax=Enterococcus phage vB_OCPT_Car TaxID=2922319 RepID=A0A9E7DUX8_9CAUD|nr:hypothetical protein [Enterococcus phage vB_EfaM_Ef2.1]UQS99991.1 hypothetical protein NGDEOPKE_00036 [Enterococcus phage vB_OCPT_Carl]UQT00209.1 hypothetical protein EGEOBHOM_00050 [Enterococcus phage vB_OCPT_Car]
MENGETRHFLNTLVDTNIVAWEKHLNTLRKGLHLYKTAVAYNQMYGSYELFLYIRNEELNRREVIPVSVDGLEARYLYLDSYNYSFHKLGEYYDKAVISTIEKYVRQVGRSHAEAKELGIRKYKETSRNNRTQTRKFKPRKGNIK